jgi:predicted amidohydrolase
MKVDLLIKNGMIVDPARNLEHVGDLAIKNGKIVDAGGLGLEADRAIDADGCLVLPGLIDFHAHVYTPGTEIGINANSACLPQGVTAVVDGGSAGVANYDNFVRTAVAFSEVRMFGLVNVSPTGLPTLRYHEDVNPKHYDADALEAIFAKYRGQVLALKVRQSRDIVGEMGLEPLKATVKIADRIGCPVVVHVTDPPCSLDKIADELRPKDVFCHVFQGTGLTIIGEDRKVLPGIKAARERGVIFDASNGKGHFSFIVARAAIADGFLPDVISTDLTVLTMYIDYAFGVPYLMSKYLSLGVKLMDVVAACTSTPASLMGLKGVLGTLAPGAVADVAILRRVQRPTRFKDTPGEIFVGDQLLINQMTVLGGKIVYRQIDFGT